MQLRMFEENKIEERPQLRYYQQQCAARVMEAFQEHRAVLAVLATGLGKTQIFSSIVSEWKGPVLVLAHRGELVDQAAKRLALVSGEDVEIEQADLYAGRGRIIVGSVQTVTNDKRIARLRRTWDWFYPDQTPLIVTDEAHRYTAKSFRKPLDAFPKAKVLGVTATPKRHDKQALGKIFDVCAFEMGIVDGIEEGWLVPIVGRDVHVESVNLNSVGISAGDFQLGQLDDEMLKGAEVVARKTLEIAPERQGIVFCPGVKTAHLVTDKFNALKPFSAACVDGKTPKDERALITRQFRDGKLQFLVNCQVATEGFDAPGCSLIVQARPTRSAVLYTQMIGRGTRTLPESIKGLYAKDQAAQRRDGIAASPKKDCLVLDFAGDSRPDLKTSGDVLGGKYTDAEVKQAKKVQKNNPDQDVLSCLKEARAMMRAIAARSNATVKASVTTFDPFRAVKLQPGERNKKAANAFGGDPMTPKQREYLQKQGVPEGLIADMRRRDFAHFVQKAQRRREKGLASYKQLRMLAKFGFKSDKVTHKAASKAMDYLAKQGWGTRGVSADTISKIIRTVDGKAKSK